MSQQNKQISEDKQRELMRQHFESVVNGVFNTKDGKEFIKLIMNWCHFWTPTPQLIRSGFKPEEIIAMQDVVKNCIFKHLDPQKIGVLIAETKKGK